MQGESRSFSCVVLGEQSLLIQCCEGLLSRGHAIQAVVAENRRIVEWCSQRGIACFKDFEGIRVELASVPFEYLFSITNLRMVPDWLLAMPSRLAINFHDGPLPKYAGLNAPVWALIRGEPEHGITWHVMEKGADTGPILVNRRFEIASDDTAFNVNARCYEAGLEAFAELVDKIEAGSLQPQPQDHSLRTYFGLQKRPDAAAVLDWSRPASELLRLVRALDFGPYANTVILPKLDLGDRLLLARQAEIAPAAAGMEPGTIQALSPDSLTVRCADGALKILRVTCLKGDPVDVAQQLRTSGLGERARLPVLDSARASALGEETAAACAHEGFWLRRLMRMEPMELPFASKSTGATGMLWKETPWAGSGAGGPQAGKDSGVAWIAAISLLLARLGGKTEFSLAYVPSRVGAWPRWLGRFFASVVPLPVSSRLEESFERWLSEVGKSVAESEKRTSYLCDLPAREPELRSIPDCAAFPIRIVRVPRLDEADARRLEGGAAMTIVVPEDGASVGFLIDESRLERRGLERFIDCLQVLVRQIQAGDARPARDLDLLSTADREQIASFSTGSARESAGNGTARSAEICVHELLEEQAGLTPDKPACVFEGASLTYRELNEAANRLARYLKGRGVQIGDLVGVLVDRSLEMMVALCAVHKAGAAYVPLDPVYPRDRLVGMMEDAGLRHVITQRAHSELVAAASPILLEDLGQELQSLPADNLRLQVTPSNLAYVIYTSGSTGKPKGVMVEHRNVANFFAGMDSCIGAAPGVWLAVTSISFDISVLELFWTLARGFTVVLYSDAVRQKKPRARARSSKRPIQFGFFYWNVANDESVHEKDKYRLLVEGAKFADAHGFNAVWNPERHFEAFGGLFPNPSVTCAAISTITSKVALRAGSCVVPLHSPIRIAEEWAVVDNLSNGRVGISIAAGWAPPDFVIKPENFTNAKQIMFESAQIVRRLWRGEKVPLPGPKGDVMVRTLPRPLQKDLPLWVTTAGNVETFIQAGKLGMNLLTHLLGQTVEEVAEKVRAYRAAWSEAGHPGSGTVTLMLHTFVGRDAASVESSVRQPLKDYLKSAMFLVKAAAWQFPTFKKMSDEQGKTLDQFFATISPEDMDGLLEFAFQRYFRTSGLFGTPDECLKMVDRVSDAGVDEIACLIDFGIDTDVVLAHLPHLDELRERSQRIEPQEAAAADEDHSLPSLFGRHRVSHFQCTPSMATMLASDRSAQPGLAALQHMMVGGEAFPPELARSLKGILSGRLTNMYGPTETTIWSSVGDVNGEQASPANSVSIGRPLANQTIYILDPNQKPLPPGLTGELVIGGAGVVRGYWQRDELTADRFLPDPFAAHSGGRMYRTGDLARYLPDGRIECLGRVDHQVKIRGYRVELGEIEALLRSHEQVLEAAVVLREDTPGDQRLVGYVRSTSGSEIAAETLKDWLRRQLPEFMVPSVYVPVTEMPLTPNGKINRKALPAPKVSSAASTAYAPPQSEAEAMIAEIWQTALGMAKVGVRDNFFDIGGHSLLVVQVLKALRDRVAKPIQMTDLFKYATVETLARFVSGGEDASSSEGRGKSRADARRAALERRRRG